MRMPYFFLTLALSVGACATSQDATTMTAAKRPIATVPHVDLPRFMGPWYVLASIPTFIEKGAYNAVETYALDPDGSIATTFTFHKGSFDGPVKTMKPRGFVRDASQSVWGMQFIWPIKAEYLIAYLAPDYSQVVIARNARDYVWIMARQPTVAPAEYERLVKFVGDLGYDVTKLQRVPQRWP